MDTKKSFIHQYTTMAGMLFFLAGSVILMGIITAEIFYPSGYSTPNSEISDLPTTRPPDSHRLPRPSASIFNATMILGGLLILAASFFLFRDLKSWIVIFPALLGTGVLGVGLFPGNSALFHPLFALMAFIAGGVSAIILSKITPSPFRYMLAFLGLISLVFSLLLLHDRSGAGRRRNGTVCRISRGHLGHRFGVYLSGIEGSTPV